MVAGCVLLTVTSVHGQQKEGKVTYERISQMQIHINTGNGDNMDNVLPRTRTENFELTFGNNQSLWKQVEKESEDEDQDVYGWY